MTTHRIVGQPPKLWTDDGRFLRLARDGETLASQHYLTVDEGGGFDDYPPITHTFRVAGTVVRRVSNGSASVYAVTEVDVPTSAESVSADGAVLLLRSGAEYHTHLCRCAVCEPA